MLGSTASRSRAFVTFDGLFSIIPALIIILFTMNVANFLTDDSVERMHEQQQFDKLVSIADYVVKQGAVKTGKIGNTDVRYPNWIEQAKVNSALADDLKKRANLKALSIKLGGPGEESVCVYRIVVVGDSKNITTLYVCGD